MKLAFAIAASATLALSACSSGNEDALDNEVLNTANEDLNAIANQAAADAAAAEAQALSEQQAQLNEEASAPADTGNPSDADEQNVAGM